MPNFYNDNVNENDNYFWGASLEIILKIIFKIILTEAPTIIYLNFKFNFEGEARPKDLKPDSPPSLNREGRGGSPHCLHSI